MSEDTSVSSGDQTQSASGDAVEAAPKSDDVVKYETHQKLLGEKKRLQEKFEQTQRQLEEFNSREKQRTEAELKQKEDFKKLLEMREQELEQTRQRLNSLETQTTDSQKLAAFVDTLGSQLKPGYYNLVDLNNIVYDSETGQVDEMSVAKEVERFRKEFPEVVVKPGKAPVPSDYPQGASGPKSFADLSPKDKLNALGQKLANHTNRR